jgi:hypothetical protein
MRPIPSSDDGATAARRPPLYVRCGDRVDKMNPAGSGPGDAPQNGMRCRARKQHESHGRARDIEMVTIRHSGFSSKQNRAVLQNVPQASLVFAIVDAVYMAAGLDKLRSWNQ